MPKQVFLFIPLVIFLALGYFLWDGLSRDPRELPSALIGKTLPPFELQTLQSPEKYITNEVLLTSVETPFLLNVWGSWCPSCRVEHGFLERIANAGIPIVGLNYKDERHLAMAFLNELGNPYLLNIFDIEGNLGLDLGVYGAPETYIIGANGEILHRRVGVMDLRVWKKDFASIWPQYDLGGSIATYEQNEESTQ